MIELYQLLKEEIGKRSIDATVIPSSIATNLNENFEIRPYQEDGFKYFINYWEESFQGKPKKNHQLLFHMATGSGKTLMMAGLITYLYTKGYRNFLFFVNSRNIINKTKDNFLNISSHKYLFSNLIKFQDKQVNIREVKNFQTASQNDINIVFDTIQGLHSRLRDPHENAITYDDFENKKIVLISDEAHHLNVDTKKGGLADQDELIEAISWESTVEKIFNANSENVLLEFTATIDFSDALLSEKYKPKLIFDYPLKQFRKDGYSKEVKVLQSDLDPMDRSLQAVILSQYRRKIFEKNGLNIKPVILFKSKKISESKDFYSAFVEKISKVDELSLERIRDTSANAEIHKAFNFLQNNNISLSNFSIEIQEDFSPEKLISVNSKEESEEKQIAVNSLETNQYRAVFAVDKLNEGWDVLNLYDIVRLYDTRDAKSNKVGKTTMSEAQLIGRGARYCPFAIGQDQPLYARKYDFDIENELRICEELYYHSAYNPKYIQELNVALRDIGIKSKESRQKKLFVKDLIKKTNFFKSGHIFLNEKKKYLRSEIQGLDTSVTEKIHTFNIQTGFGRTDLVFEDGQTKQPNIQKSIKELMFLDLGAVIIKKSIMKIDFYRFNNLKHYLPNLISVDEFIFSPNYLGKVKLEVSGPELRLDNLTADDKLMISTKILIDISENISSDKIEFKGTKEFKPKMIKDIFLEKTLNFMLDDGADKEYGKSMVDPAETAFYLDLSEKEWYAFNDCYGTSEEKLLIHFINKKISELKAIYSEVFLMRNERHFQIYNFSDGRAFEPDFILFLIGKEPFDTKHYQIFIEPKGGHLLRADEWKEKFLLDIQKNSIVEQLFENKKYIIWGLPFFNSIERMTEFESEYKRIIN